jgi:UDP-GlcNAc3NAcA epimerase
MRKLCIVAGTRPNLIKVPPLLAASKELGLVVDLVDTRQHYDTNMRGVFYEELELPSPKEDIPEDTECVIVIGDTNSTLAGALMACERGIPVAHVEAGCRCWNKQLPEEVNRVMVDALSDYLFCPTPMAADNVRGIYVGDVLYDMYKKHAPVANGPSTHVLFTMHRAGNTVTGETVLEELYKASEIAPVLFPIHPRTRRVLDESKVPQNVTLVDPVSYTAMLHLIAKSFAVFTDSGGVQREAYWSGVPFKLMREETEWPETMYPENQGAFGDGRAAYNVMEILADE